MVDIAFISLFDFLVRAQDFPEQARAAQLKAIAISDRTTDAKLMDFEGNLTDPSRSPNLAVDWQEDSRRCRLSF
jgi:hypothetical protein